MGEILARMFQRKPNYSLGSNQIGVSVSTEYISSDLKFSDGDGPNLCRVKK